VIAVFACHIPALWVTYSNGVPNLGWWTRGAGRSVAWSIEGTLVSTAQFKPADVFEMFIGGGITIFLLFMRQRFLWWPFHPLGFVANTTGGVSRYWFALFIGWSVKMIVTWLGGVRLW